MQHSTSTTPVRRHRAFQVAALVLSVVISRTAAAETEQGESRSSRHDDDEGRTHLAVDFDVSHAVGTPRTESGGGGAIRIGRELDLLLVSLTPEIGGGYHAFSGDSDTRLYTAFAGGRLGVGKIIEPSVFAHLGIARVTGTERRTAPMLDAGIALDFTLLPLIDLGAHAAYGSMLPRDDGSVLKFVTVGLHAALVF